ncbi:MAG: lamin tail domain-containing protein [Minicystis sp.]
MLGTVVTLTGAWGCELISSVDRGKIPGAGGAGTGGTGGVGGAAVSSSGTATSSSGMGGTGGTGGMTTSSTTSSGTGGSGTGGTGGMTTSSTTSSGTGGSGTGGAGTGGMGTGGTGGMMVSSSSSSSGDAGTTCTLPTDCPGADTECQQRTCTNGVCGTSFTAVDTPIAAQKAGDCLAVVCDGAGATKTINDDTDLPDDQNPCTKNLCNGGVATNPAEMSGTVCGTGLICDGNGACVGCITGTDCPGSDTECRTRTCTNGMCGVSFTTAGTAVTAQTAGDCKKDVCDGSGNVASSNDDTDVPADDGNQCTSDTCNAGAVVHPPKAVNTACTQNGGSFCSAIGTCVACNAATQCAGQDTECQTRTCNAGACGFSFTTANTPVAAQTAADCKKNVCNGSGGITTINDDADVPADDGNQCTNDTCNAGVPTHPLKAANTACNQNGGSFCDATGTCVACTTAAQCPGQDTECQTRTCNAGTCGFSFTASGTAVAAQTAGDCQKNVCNGSGGIASVADNSDVPADDGNQCTTDTCNAGAPVHPPTGSGTTCNQNGGTTCNGAGVCVGCVNAAQCPGQDTECQTRTCNAGVCGFAFTAANTPVAAQTAADCQKNVCNGSGGITSVADDTDLPADDGNQCTNDTCNAGAVVHPPKAVNTGCSQNGGAFCDATGTCVACNTAAQCPGSDTECQARTCNAGVCGFSFTAANTPVAAQTAGDCQKNVCNGSGGITSTNDDTDVPADDGNQCTLDACMGGAVVHPPKAVNTACTQNGGAFCDATGTCVACNTAAQCPGSDTECQTRTCNAGTCGFSFASAGTLTSGQTAGDCKKIVCDGSGGTGFLADPTDVQDDGNECTADTCNAGNPVHTPVAPGAACGPGGSLVCDGSGSCVQCVTAATCPGSDTECQTRTCNAGTCGFAFTTAGTVTSAQTAGDCKQNQCDGSGTIVAVAFTGDLPVDNNECTADVCSGAAPSNPPVAAGTPCNQNGGSACDGNGSCVGGPDVAGTTPADGANAAASTTIAVSFTVAMNPATLTGQTAAGACSGSIQVSLDGFATCIAFSAAAPVMNGSNTVATFTAAPGLLVNRTYKIRVTTAAHSAADVPLNAQYTAATGFGTTSPNLCDGSLVISQVYGGGGLSNATYKNDFIELHNRGTTTVNLTGMSLQYTAATGSAWASNKLNLSGSVPPGGYFLIQGASGGSVGATLPAADQTWGQDLAQANGKIALVNSTTGMGASTCPDATAIDYVGFGTANCAEGGTAVSALSSILSAQRRQSGCSDINVNRDATNGIDDFVTATPAPRNSATAASVCACTVQNESGAALEADYCNVQFPSSLSVQTATSTGNVFGQIFESGTTEAAGLNTNVRAQLGYGPATANPEYAAAWKWFNASYNTTCTSCGNNDEYQASFTAPAVGSYRYAFRFSLDQGVSWTYCDQGSDTGAGANGGLSFELADLPVLTVTP